MVNLVPKIKRSYCLFQLLYGSVFILNFFLKFSIRFISRWELHETQTKLNVSVALKLTIARFMNSSFVLYSVNINS